MASSQFANVPKGFHVKYVDDIAVLVLNNEENRLNITSVRWITDALDKVKRNQSAKALVIIGVGKFFSNGLDLQWLSQQPTKIGVDFFEIMNELLLRLVTFPLPTIAALNGHSFGAGCILALLCDCRVMRTKRGWMCLPEVKLKLQFSTMLMDLIKLKTPPQVARDMVLYGKRYTANEALKIGLVEVTCEENQLLKCACQLAKQCLGKNGLDRDILKAMKMDLYGTTMEKSAMKDAKTMANSFDRYKRALTSKL